MSSTPTVPDEAQRKQADGRRARNERNVEHPGFGSSVDVRPSDVDAALHVPIRPPKPAYKGIRLDNEVPKLKGVA